jgi:hypothetical protein
MKLDRTLEENYRRVDREKAPRPIGKTPDTASGENLQLAFDGVQLRVKYQGRWWVYDNGASNWIIDSTIS